MSITKSEDISILVIEDDIIVARFVESVLQRSGYSRTRRAHDPDSALESCESIDVAFTDIHLGTTVDGIGIAEQLQRRFATQIVFITAFDDDRTLQRALALNPASYLLKPFDERDLRVALELAVRKLKIPSHRKTNLAMVNTDQMRQRIEESLIQGRLFLNPDLTFGALADHLGLTTHQLSEMFNRVMGTSFRDYLRRLRIEEACRLLKGQSDSSILRIALDVGFNSRSTFYDAFRRLHGISPEDFRRNAQTRAQMCDGISGGNS